MHLHNCAGTIMLPSSSGVTALPTINTKMQTLAWQCAGLLFGNAALTAHQEHEKQHRHHVVEPAHAPDSCLLDGACFSALRHAYFSATDKANGTSRLGTTALAFVPIWAGTGPRWCLCIRGSQVPACYGMLHGTHGPAASMCPAVGTPAVRLGWGTADSVCL